MPKKLRYFEFTYLFFKPETNVTLKMAKDEVYCIECCLSLSNIRLYKCLQNNITLLNKQPIYKYYH